MIDKYPQVDEARQVWHCAMMDFALEFWRISVCDHGPDIL